MNHLEQWKAISARIAGLMKAAEVDARYLLVRNSDTHGAWKQLRLQTQQIHGVIEEFLTAHAGALSGTATLTVQTFLDDTRSLVFTPVTNKNAGSEMVKATIVMLAAFETELSFVLTDTQEAIRLRSERAFSHLQRSIIADEEICKKWKAAFLAGEERCEKLGSVHLLSHGIWAFKAHAIAGRTDLVFQDVIGDGLADQGFADGLVLTEWKVARAGENTDNKYREARDQAKDYSQGILAGAELTGYRYAIVVSLKQTTMPSDQTSNGVTWRHINIAVEPDRPSVASKLKKNKS